MKAFENKPFENKKFLNENGWLSYDGEFIGRFDKYGGLGAFKKFLRHNFTVAEYFAELGKGKAPLEILNKKGYVSPNVSKACKMAGFPATQEGVDAMIKDRIKRYKNEKTKLETL